MWRESADKSMELEEELLTSHCISAQSKSYSLVVQVGGYYWVSVAHNRYKPSHELGRLDKGCEPQYGPNNNWLTPHTALSIQAMTSHPDYPLVIIAL